MGSDLKIKKLKRDKIEKKNQISYIIFLKNYNQNKMDQM